jgi:hypothetical protein
VFILYNNEKSRVVAKEFNATTQSRLCINSKFICIIKNNAFEQSHIIALDIRFSKIFEFVANKFDSLPMSAIYKHHVIFNTVAVSTVDAVYKIIHNGSFATPGGTVKNNVGDFAYLDEIVQFGRHKIVFVKNGCN